MTASIGDGGYSADMDLDRDGFVGSSTEWQSEYLSWYIDGLNATAVPDGGISETNAAAIPNVAVAPDNPIGYCGYVFNPEVRLYHVPFQWYSPELGESLRSSFSTANAEHEAATSAFGTAHQEPPADALSALGAEEEATIRTCLASPEQGIPLEFRVATCSDVDWGEVSRALVAEARAERSRENAHEIPTSGGSVAPKPIAKRNA